MAASPLPAHFDFFYSHGGKSFLGAGRGRFFSLAIGPPQHTPVGLVFFFFFFPYHFMRGPPNKSPRFLSSLLPFFFFPAFFLPAPLLPPTTPFWCLKFPYPSFFSIRSKRFSFPLRVLAILQSAITFSGSFLNTLFFTSQCQDILLSFHPALSWQVAF